MKILTRPISGNKTTFFGLMQLFFLVWLKYGYVAVVFTWNSSYHHGDVERQFFSIWFLFHGYWRFAEQQKEMDYLYSSLVLLPSHKHSDIYLQFCIWDVCLIFVILAHVISRTLPGKIFQTLGISIRFNINCI